MAAVDVTITRGIGTRDDYLDVNLSTTDSGSVTTDTVTTDGDLMTWNVIFTNPTNGDTATRWRAISGGPNSSTYTKVLVRVQVTSWASTSFQLRYWIHYANSQTDTGNGFLTGTTTSQNVYTFTLTVSNQPVDQIGLLILDAATVGAGTYNFTVIADFIYVFKETLTLPAASQPLSLSLSRRIAALQVPNREGDILQDLGSASPNLEVNGTLITTSSPNNYTGDQWWDVMVGAWLEHNWQWFSSDRVAYKYQITDLIPTQNPGIVGFYVFKLRLRKVDIVTATAQTFSSNNNPAGAIQ